MTAQPLRLPGIALPSPAQRVAVDHRRPRVLGLLVVAFVVVASFFVLIYSRIALDRTAFELADIENRIRVEESRYWDLRLEVAELHSPDRIVGAATDVGLVFPTEVRTIAVPGLTVEGLSSDEDWARLKALLGEQP